MAYDIYAQTPVDDGDGVRPQSDAEIEIELRNAARNGDLVIRRRTATGSEFVAGSEQVDLGGGAGIQPDATRTLAGRSTYDAEAAGFVSIWRPIKARPNTISGRAHPVGLRPLRCGDQRATQDRQGLLEQPEQLDRLVPKEIRARPAPPPGRRNRTTGPAGPARRNGRNQQLAQRAPRAMSALAYSSGRALRLQAQQATISGS